jgi:cyclophilin family peptidyl-prolyl cis-trans isomerase
MRTLLHCCTLILALAAARPAAADIVNPIVRFTFLGSYSMDVELFQDAVPDTVNNFLSYVESGAYTNTILHRSTTYVQPGPGQTLADVGHVVQGGGFAKLFQLTGPEVTPIQPGAPIDLDAILPHTKGTIAMARGEDPNSATNQWFFNTKDNPIYNGSYTVFGQITAGIEVLDLFASLGVYSDNLDVYTSPTTFEPVPFGELPIAFAGSTPLLVTATSVAVVPEPSTLALAAGGIGLALAAARRKRYSAR